MNYVLAGKQVCFWPVKRATQSDFVTKKVELPTTFCNNFSQPATTLQYLLQDRFDSGVVKRARSLFNSFCSNVSKTRCTFLLHRAKITKERNCLVCVASRIGVRQCLLEARNSPKWSQFHARRSLVVFKKENTSQRYCWKEKKKS